MTFISTLSNQKSSLQLEISTLGIAFMLEYVGSKDNPSCGALTSSPANGYCRCIRKAPKSRLAYPSTLCKFKGTVYLAIPEIELPISQREPMFSPLT